MVEIAMCMTSRPGLFFFQVYQAATMRFPTPPMTARISAIVRKVALLIIT
jgi:hypothetical protein